MSGEHPSRHSPLHDAAALLSAPVAPDTYEMLNRAEFAIHKAALVLKGIDRLILDGVGPDNSTADLKELLEIVGQLVDATATYVQEAYNEADNVSVALSGAHQR